MNPDDPNGLAERGYARLLRDYRDELERARISAEALVRRLPAEPPAADEPAHVYRIEPWE